MESVKFRATEMDNGMFIAERIVTKKYMRYPIGVDPFMHTEVKTHAERDWNWDVLEFFDEDSALQYLNDREKIMNLI